MPVCPYKGSIGQKLRLHLSSRYLTCSTEICSQPCHSEMWVFSVPHSCPAVLFSLEVLGWVNYMCCSAAFLCPSCNREVAQKKRRNGGGMVCLMLCSSGKRACHDLPKPVLYQPMVVQLKLLSLSSAWKTVVFASGHMLWRGIINEQDKLLGENSCLPPPPELSKCVLSITEEIQHKHDTLTRAQSHIRLQALQSIPSF